MNIIKFNDTPMWYYLDDSKEDGKSWYVDGDELGKDNIVVQEARKEISTFFEEYLRGKYAYIVNWEYVIPFEFASNEEVMDIEKGSRKIDDYDNLPITKINNEDAVWKSIQEKNDLPNRLPVIDMEGTDNINDITMLCARNSITMNGYPDVELAKTFRQWLAKSMYTVIDTYLIKDKVDMLVNIKDVDNVKLMLNYYKENMYDDTIKSLTVFTSPTMQLSPSTNIASCNQCATEFVYAPGTMNVCNPVQMYKEGMYNYMVQTFSNVEYWKSIGAPIYKEVMDMIDVIIQYNFPLIPSNPLSTYADCTCLNKANATEELLKGILRNFRQAMQYFKDGKVEANMLFVTTALKDWSMYLYEKMYWAESNETLQASYWKSIKG